eukprot:gene47101-63834_t
MTSDRQHEGQRMGRAAAENPTASHGFSAGQAVSAFLLAAALVVAMGLRGLPGVLAGGLVNPDSTMRLLRLQEWLAHGKLVHLIARDGSGEGNVLPWSHFLDAILLAAAAPLAARPGDPLLAVRPTAPPPPPHRPPPPPAAAGPTRARPYRGPHTL